MKGKKTKKETAAVIKKKQDASYCLVSPQLIVPVFDRVSENFSRWRHKELAVLRDVLLLLTTAPSLKRTCICRGTVLKLFMLSVKQSNACLDPTEEDLGKFRCYFITSSVVSKATSYGLDDRGFGVRVPVWSRFFSFRVVQIGSVVHLTSYPVGTGVKAARA
jgi:hypothetical protein